MCLIPVGSLWLLIVNKFLYYLRYYRLQKAYYLDASIHLRKIFLNVSIAGVNKLDKY